LETVTPYKEIIEVIKAQGGEAFKRCFQCGLCDALCPWNRVTRFSMRKLVREATFGLTEIESEDLWRCTTCGRCPQQCPRDVRQIESGVALRRIATEYGVFPGPVKPIRAVSGSLIGEGNPLNEERKNRAAWADGLEVPAFQEGMEFLYFPGCYLCYDPRLRKVARATAEILKRAGVDFGILGEKENCCGESIRKTGDEGVFRRLARENIKTFIDHGVQKILVSSPHCYHTFTHEYPEFRVHFEVIHISQFLRDLIADGKIGLTKALPKTATYHDPCYLGRHNGFFDPPREVLQRIPGLKFSEMSERRRRASVAAGEGGESGWRRPRGNVSPICD
jgi:Fe-S oxidoreductase